MTTLPTYEQAQTDVLENVRPSALSVFITEYEPAGIVEENKFRRELGDVIAEIQKQTADEQKLISSREMSAMQYDHREQIHQLQMDLEFAKADRWFYYWTRTFSCFAAGALAAIFVLYFVAVFFGGAMP